MSKTLLSKKEAAIEIIESLKSPLQCPICHESLNYNGQFLTCIHKHSFDISKTGYLNLSNRADDLHYTKELFEHRHVIMGRHNLYKPLLKLIDQSLKDGDVILDAGTGEGSLLNGLNEKTHKLGIDLSKQGIQVAAKYYRDTLWIIADLAKIPLADQTVDVLLSILSPANYQEFKRVLKKEGTVIKVLPDRGYFKELRSYQSYQYHDNTLVLNRFHEEFQDFKSKHLNYKVEVDSKLRESLLMMSPLAWNMSEDDRLDYIKSGPNTLSLHLLVLIGTHK